MTALDEGFERVNIIFSSTEPSTMSSASILNAIDDEFAPAAMVTVPFSKLV